VLIVQARESPAVRIKKGDVGIKQERANEIIELSDDDEVTAVASRECKRRRVPDEEVIVLD
jgi:hypothetical protein